eukprot:SAG31_NODE_2250_length_6083_cov_3.636531_1_plen_222_part_00
MPAAVGMDSPGIDVGASSPVASTEKSSLLAPSSDAEAAAATETDDDAPVAEPSVDSAAAGGDAGTTATLELAEAARSRLLLAVALNTLLVPTAITIIVPALRQVSAPARTPALFVPCDGSCCALPATDLDRTGRVERRSFADPVAVLHHQRHSAAVHRATVRPLRPAQCVAALARESRDPCESVERLCIQAITHRSVFRRCCRQSGRCPASCVQLPAASSF